MAQKQEIAIRTVLALRTGKHSHRHHGANLDTHPRFWVESGLVDSCRGHMVRADAIEEAVLSSLCVLLVHRYERMPRTTAMKPCRTKRSAAARKAGQNKGCVLWMTFGL